MKIKKENKITLKRANQSDFNEFKRELQEAFAVAVVENFDDSDSEPIPPDEVIRDSFNAPSAVVYNIYLDDHKVGGIILNINKETHNNSVDLFYISPKYHSQGIGLATWNAVEEMYAETLVWELVTPYFEKRNIHFYVNKCRFHIVEFYNELNPDPHQEKDINDGEGIMPGSEPFFRFQKVMKQQLY